MVSVLFFLPLHYDSVSFFPFHFHLFTFLFFSLSLKHLLIPNPASFPSVISDLALCLSPPPHLSHIYCQCSFPLSLILPSASCLWTCQVTIWEPLHERCCWHATQVMCWDTDVHQTLIRCKTLYACDTLTQQHMVDTHAHTHSSKSVNTDVNQEHFAWTNTLVPYPPKQKHTNWCKRSTY